ncbi:hypothetical protein GCM10007913_36060 [Devosia yakushimensis]|uniref:MAPEG family protein n=1 Tax=Devosia yakushimensis TaxID=470028 RepID=A0ABQ5UHV4_9HYPH|nr:MAPEG family protein [Devosia yakushimensis]GLQ11674.1 hypothetical protein GCM10007913_36060 [Devosia yakushimensis]
MPDNDQAGIAGERRKLMWGAAIALPLAVVAWLALFWLTPPVASAEEPLARLVYALNWVGVAVLLTFLTAIEAVSHERLFTPAIDPLAGRESARMKVNLRYLQHTLEQLLVFIPGLLLLAWHSGNGAELRAVTATAIVWIALRIVFWVGYHISPSLRTPGLVGMAMSMVVLLYCVARFGYELAGPVGAAVPLVLFGGAEMFLVWISQRPARD